MVSRPAYSPVAPSWAAPDGREAGDAREVVVQARDHLGVALRLVGQRGQVHVGDLGPRGGDHLRRRVQLHRARAERDHRVVQAQVLALEALEVAQHLALRLDRVEHGVLHERSSRAVKAPGAARCRVDRLARGRVQRGLVGLDAERAEHRAHVGGRDGLAEAEADGRRVDHAHVAARGGRGGLHGRAVGHRHLDGVEERTVTRDREARALELGRARRRERVAALRDVLQPVGAVVHAVARGHVREQRLRGADVARRLVAADVLLARLHRHAQRGLVLRVDRHADDAAGHAARVAHARRHEGRVRAEPSARRSAARADRDVGAPLARRLQQRARGGSVAATTTPSPRAPCRRLRERGRVARAARVQAARARRTACSCRPRSRSCASRQRRTRCRPPPRACG